MTDSTADPGDELRRLRRARSLTLRELADRVAFDYSYLAAVERGDRPGSPLLAASVDEALDARVGWSPCSPPHASVKRSAIAKPLCAGRKT